ncbi:MAG TPA: DUF2834 domain-containing protein [Myxococcales bacterium]|nr:DUF2834 domain-containing protein [Deltaproteobacteria bacterium]MBU53432.1 DUF2834 domain-containing protein [Deltaproteobacteria bacterium]HAA57330.1 DUF2834 domain-containing protein [Myxococcales bacterium]|tara:strand:- start:1316 stop:1642 length:327 start_codon:yes stop_codon:yes gene_type:complete
MRLFIGVVLFAFSFYTAWIVWQFGYTSVFTETLRSHPSTQVLFDLFISGGLLTLVMIVDNHRKGRSFVTLIPFLLLTLSFASIGLLLYVLVYPDLLSFRPQTKQDHTE